MSKAKQKGTYPPGAQKRSSRPVLVPGSSETTWIIEPYDPLIVRDGRPFGAHPSAQATSLSFPFPSTTTGGVRTRAGLKADGTFDTSQIERVKKIKVRGPLLVRLSQSGESIEEWLVPAPADALLLEETSDRLWCKPLVPLICSGAEFNPMRDNSELMLVGPVQPDLRKPAKDAPLYWHWEAFEQWLLQPVEGTQSLDKLGRRGPLHEHRLHVSLNPETLTARTGALFETSGLEFTVPGANLETRLSTAQRLALAVVVDRKETPTLLNGLASLGGERRMVSWRRGDRQLPDCPAQILQRICKQQACRVILLTPACLARGYQPTWLLEPRDGVEPQLQAIAIRQPLVVSGWQFEPPAGPKPTRRLAPAGSVFFLRLHAKDSGAIEHWVKEIWMRCISDDEQARNDGFGLAVLGSGCVNAHTMAKVRES